MDNSLSPVMDVEVDKLVSKGVLVLSRPEPFDFYSRVFLVQKKDGVKFRMIINLRCIKEKIIYKHFKMSTVETCIALIHPNCYLASIDLRDAYFSVRVNSYFQKCLKFIWRGVHYQFTGMPQGLASAPRYFTKLLKPIMALLQSKGISACNYLDDVFISAPSKQDCVTALHETICTFQQLGFYVNFEKSTLQPSTQLEHLGFNMNSKLMEVSITEDRVQRLHSRALPLIQGHATIRQVMRFIGTIESCKLGVKLAYLYKHRLEADKNAAMASCGKNFDIVMSVSEAALQDVQWWLSSAKFCPRPIITPPVYITLYTDASNKGWGAVCDGVSTGGHWSSEEQEMHINALEILAVKNGLLSLCQNLNDVHIEIHSDNITTVAYVNDMGGNRSLICNDLARDIWLWANSQGLWLSAQYIPGEQNCEADSESRLLNDRTEWHLCRIIFSKLCSVLNFSPQVDLFASRLNFQVNCYVSWKPDPGAYAVNAFHMNWNNIEAFLFPPFSVIPRVLQKLSTEQGRALIVVPLWPTQPWFGMLLRMLIQQPVLLPNRRNLLTLPFDQQRVHPLYPKMRLIAAVVSGKHSETVAFLEKLATSSSALGAKEPFHNMVHTSEGGWNLQVQGISIPLIPLI